MTNTNIIRCYAASHGNTIVRKDFISWFGSEYPDGSVRSIDTELRQMVADGVLERTGFGRFRMLLEEKPPYIPVVSPEMKELFGQIKVMYPYANFCIWQARALSSFMQHVPSLDVLILETDRIAAETVYEDVRKIVSGRTVLLRPTEKEYRLYASGLPSILIKDLTSEAPLINVDGVPTASLEKILVDAIIAPEMEFARGAEIYTIYENADQVFRINKKTMVRYASRRGKKEEIEKLIKSTMP